VPADKVVVHQHGVCDGGGSLCAVKAFHDTVDDLLEAGDAGLLELAPPFRRCAWYLNSSEHLWVTPGNMSVRKIV
jgi:hypothetical protein